METFKEYFEKRMLIENNIKSGKGINVPMTWKEVGEKDREDEAGEKVVDMYYKLFKKNFKGLFDNDTTECEIKLSRLRGLGKYENKIQILLINGRKISSSTTFITRRTNAGEHIYYTFEAFQSTYDKNGDRLSYPDSSLDFKYKWDSDIKSIKDNADVVIIKKLLKLKTLDDFDSTIYKAENQLKISEYLINLILKKS